MSLNLGKDWEEIGTGFDEEGIEYTGFMNIKTKELKYFYTESGIELVYYE